LIKIVDKNGIRVVDLNKPEKGEKMEIEEKKSLLWKNEMIEWEKKESFFNEKRSYSYNVCLNEKLS